MSRKSYWKLQPAAKEVYLNRQRENERRNMLTLSRGINAAGAMVFVFGVCMCNLEFMLISGALAAIAYAFGKEI